MPSKYIVLYLFLSFCLLSCTDQESLDNSESLAVLRVSVGSNAAQEVSTKATFNESGIYNLHVLVYNGSGNLIGHGYSSTGNSVTLTTRVGTGNTVYAIANTYNSSLFDGSVATCESKLKTLLSSTSTLEGIKLSDASTSGLVMSGSKSNVTISSSGTTISSSDFAISRLSAKITLNITGNNYIKITGYSIKNIPSKSYDIARPNVNESLISDLAIGNDAVTTSSDYFSSTTTGLNQSTLATSFYMFENRRGGRVSVGDGTGTGTSTLQEQKSKYAPANATYVEIYATGYNFTATYKVYLGSDNSQNYNIKRNCSYTYTITLNNASDTDTRVSVSFSATDQPQANCYFVKPGGNSIRIPVAQANADGTTRLSSLTSGWTTGLLWTDSSLGMSLSGVISSVSADHTNRGVVVRTGNAEGNAVVYVKDASGNIAWSWHIWVTNYDPNSGGKTYTNNGFTFMDRNLGAKNSTMNSDSYGYLYQWGRKDPIPYTQKLYDSKGDSCVLQIFNITSSVTNYVNLAIQNPLTFFVNELTPYDWYSQISHNLYLWNTSSGLKNVYDPCPKGWRVPVAVGTTNHPWTGLPASWNGLGEDWSTTMGWYPANSWRWAGAATVGTATAAYYWTATTVPDMEGQAYHLFFDLNNILGLQTFAKGDSFAVRCVKE